LRLNFLWYRRFVPLRLFCTCVSNLHASAVLIFFHLGISVALSIHFAPIFPQVGVEHDPAPDNTSFFIFPSIKNSRFSFTFFQSPLSFFILILALPACLSVKQFPWSGFSSFSPRLTERGVLSSLPLRTKRAPLSQIGLNRLFSFLF